MLKASLFEEIKFIVEKIEADSGGGSSLSKCCVIAYLIETLELKVYTEIGVYKGRSLFPAAAAVVRNNGKAYGIDPYNVCDAYEYEVAEHVQLDVNEFLDTINFEEIYNNVLRFKENFGYNKCVEIIRDTSKNAIEYFVNKNIVIDILHIDGNHDSKFVQMDVDNYCSRVKDGGIIIFDDIDWHSVRICYEEYKKSCMVVLETETFGILIKNIAGINNEERINTLVFKLKVLYKALTDIESSKFNEDNEIPTVCVGVLTYNQEKYIIQCLESVFKQKGNFKMKVIVIDDSSNDKTALLVSEYFSELVDNTYCEAINITNLFNLGMTKNLEKCLSLFTNCNYFTFCEGDDYWTDEFRLEKLIVFMQKNSEYAFCFNKIQLYFEDAKRFDFFIEQEELRKDSYETADLIDSNFIGNFSACFYDSKYLNIIDSTIFDAYTADWFFNTYYSLFGDIGYYNNPLSVYRKHDSGEWTGMDMCAQNSKLIKLIDKYNEKLNFVYDKEYTAIRNRSSHPSDGINLENYELLIIDGCFPLEKSTFRFVEFTNILNNINSTKILSDGSDIKHISLLSTSEVVKAYKRKHPQFAGQIEEFSDCSENIDFKLMYIVFLNNAFRYVDFAIRKRRPFVFTLYPGGGFAFNNKESDFKLKKVMSTPNFVKVIVTQKPIYNYLIDKKFCKSNQIEYIFGVVSEAEKFKSASIEKKYYGIDKEMLDICFVAFKYTTRGTDKGYDIFIETAKKLYGKKTNIKFHVVGNFDERDIELAEISDRITFYGAQDPDWFDDFFKDKDIILSPNYPNQLFQGSFDGFPTASCIDAGLRKTAIFCTDPLYMNEGYFVNNEEIVILPHDAQIITDVILYYYNSPDELKAISENGQIKILDLYSNHKQINPRINLLQQMISTPYTFKEPNWIQNTLFILRRKDEKLLVKLKAIAPKQIRVAYKKIKRIFYGKSMY